MMSGQGGRAWRVEMRPPGQRGKSDWDGTVGLFIVNAPGMHPCWEYWVVSLIHLRPIAGVKPAHIDLPGATHEFMIVALDPEQPLPGLVVDEQWQPKWLRPIDVIEQFTAANDAVADRILELAVQAIVAGVASPDQGYRAWWKAAIAETSRALRRRQPWSVAVMRSTDVP